MKQGERVGAIFGAKGKKVQVFGNGVYEGDFVPIEAIGQFADDCRKHNRPNPRIRLDSGFVVYGCECWWGNEEAVKSRLEEYKKNGYEIEVIDILAIRVLYNSNLRN